MAEHIELDAHGSRYRGSHGRPYPHPIEGPWHVTLHFGEVDGVTECVGLDVRSFVDERDESGKLIARRPWSKKAKVQPVTASLVHSMNVGQLVRHELRTLRDLTKWAKASGRIPHDFDESVFERPDHRRRWTSKDLAAVAAVYVDALDRKLPPRKAVAEAFGISGSMASKLIRRARDAGLLGETTQGKPGGAKGRDER